MRTVRVLFLAAVLGPGLTLVSTQAAPPPSPASQADPADEENKPPVDNDPSPYHRALENYKIGHDDVALAAINEAEQAKPHDVPVAVLKARILTDLHRFDEATKTLNNVGDSAGSYADEVTLALADVALRRRDFASAVKLYEGLLAKKPSDPDLLLKSVYARIGNSDLIVAAKYASQLKPFDQDHPCYYFAQAALARATGKAEEADADIQTVRTIYGITVTNRYLKTYLQVMESKALNEQMNPPATNAAPAAPAKP